MDVIRTLLRNATKLQTCCRRVAGVCRSEYVEGWVWAGDKETGDWVWRGVEDELANQFNATMNISTKRRRIDDV